MTCTWSVKHVEPAPFDKTRTKPPSSRKHGRRCIHILETWIQESKRLQESRPCRSSSVWHYQKLHVAVYGSLYGRHGSTFAIWSHPTWECHVSCNTFDTCTKCPLDTESTRDFNNLSWPTSLPALSSKARAIPQSSRCDSTISVSLALRIAKPCKW